MRRRITRDDVDRALAPSPWDLANGVLYSLCETHPKHIRDDAIIAKVWLIGRAYAAALERRRIAHDSSDVFYTTTVVKKLKKSGLDNWLVSLPRRIVDPWGELALAVAVHKRLMDLFSRITGLEKRSLASKYLHFHRPNVFFLYDSRASLASGKVTPSIRSITKIECASADPRYLSMVRRCQWIRDDVSQRFGVLLTPRQVDNILLRIAGTMERRHKQIPRANARG